MHRKRDRPRTRYESPENVADPMTILDVFNLMISNQVDRKQEGDVKGQLSGRKIYN